MRLCEQILDFARWAPSGDNTQPWRFEIKNDYEVVVHGFDTRNHCVYDLDGHASQIALGALLETMTIAATGHGFRTQVSRLPRLPDTTPTFSVSFSPDASLKPSPLIPAIKQRAVQRRPFSARSLSVDDKSALEISVAPQYQVVWFETLPRKWRVARLLFRNAKLRLIMPEAFEVHRNVIEWGARFSEDKIPEYAVGVDPMTARLMRWVMQSWPRVHFFNTWLGGTILPRIQLDLIPGLLCGAHFALVAKGELEAVDQYVAGGHALQRFWLEAERLNLRLQPEMTPIIFSRYHRERRKFTLEISARELTAVVASKFAEIFGQEACVSRVLFFGRIGHGPRASSRSTRLSLSSLMKKSI